MCTATGLGVPGPTVSEYLENSKASAIALATDANLPATIAISATTFPAGAAGIVSNTATAGNFDHWTITNNKPLLNSNPVL